MMRVSAAFRETGSVELNVCHGDSSWAFQFDLPLSLCPIAPPVHVGVGRSTIGDVITPDCNATEVPDSDDTLPAWLRDGAADFSESQFGAVAGEWASGRTTEA